MCHTLARLALPQHPASRRLHWLKQVGCPGMPLVAFGFEPLALRLLLKGPPEAHRRPLSALRTQQVTLCRWDQDVSRAIAWVHRAPATGHPLHSPWTSHWELMGLRRASWFDPSQLLHAAGHRQTNVQPLPTRSLQHPPPLDDLLWCTAHAMGRLPGDPAAFAPFVQLARASGWRNQALARALCLSPRRVRQLAAAPNVPLHRARQALQVRRGAGARRPTALR
jgi:hypothetical protein